MNIALVFNLQRKTPQLDFATQEDLEFDSADTITEIRNTIEKLGHQVIMIEASLQSFEKLNKRKSEIDLVFNIAEGLKGDARESQIPIFCEMLGIPYTHSSPTTHALKLNKHLTKLLVKDTKTAVPKSFLIREKLSSLPKGMRFPLIVKPNAEGSSKGITDMAVVRSCTELNHYAQDLQTKIKGDIIAESFIEGREFTVALLGNPLRVLPIVEQKFGFLPRKMNKIASYELKWIYEDRLSNQASAYRCPAKISKDLEKEICQTSLNICQLLNVKDVARIDYRYSLDKKLYFLEINTLPGINPNPKVISYLPIAARTAGLSFQDLLAEIINSAVSRYR